ncbi:DUF427 domain-containing protein [Candidatus Viridilinea mediisalina]|uniref:DUF427 domain-containing protein n=1 Tax=Candidatus Viridilinea mediisalina TaxID=2024553 RepID=A0A2A6RI81_9CHLR|nr:DUF427 domain-containing protein [Candidatus Viridilinea mediisalina]PDW02550.1 hypothetical protein CJ255_13410 [Candidatus Viridilinea mediisalina]
MQIKRNPVGPGQESVWDYPRPPRLEPCASHIQIFFAQTLIAETHQAFRVLETSHPPTYYLPPADVRMEYLQRSPGGSFCEFKGAAIYYSLRVGNHQLPSVAWAYPRPTRGFESLANYLAFFAEPMDGCFVDGERVTPQPGGFYGGWVTSKVVGPFKGGPGTRGW